MKIMALICCALASTAARAQELNWIDQFGTSGFDSVAAVATDVNNVYATGRIGFAEALPGQASAGSVDSYLRQYDGDGNEIWTRQFGTPEADFARDLAVHEDHIYAAGGTTGAFPGEVLAGGVDVFIRKYDSSGNSLWTRQFGTPGVEFSLGLTVVAEGIYVFGATSGEFPGETSAGGFDLFLAKLDPTGDLIWARQFGTAGDDPAIFLLGGVTADDTGVYVGSSVASAVPGQSSVGDADAILRKYAHDGTEIWTSQFGTACLDLLAAVKTGPDGLYIAGSTTGKMADPFFSRCSNAPIPNRNFGNSFTTYVRALTTDGVELWTQQDGRGDESNAFSLATDLAVDETGVYVTGELVAGNSPETFSLACSRGLPSEDIRIRAYDLAGSVRWTQRFGSTETDAPQAIAIQGSDLVVGGATFCSLLGEVSSGTLDAFVLEVDIGP